MRIPLAVLIAVLSTGCARIVIHRKSDAPLPVERVTERYTVVAFGNHSMSAPISLADRCPEPLVWQDATTEVNGWQALARVATVNLYSPWTVEVTCVRR